jgi:hypothetical protein
MSRQESGTSAATCSEPLGGRRSGEVPIWTLSGGVLRPVGCVVRKRSGQDVGPSRVLVAHGGCGSSWRRVVFGVGGWRAGLVSIEPSAILFFPGGTSPDRILGVR